MSYGTRKLCGIKFYGFMVSDTVVVSLKLIAQCPCLLKEKAKSVCLMARQELNFLITSLMHMNSI